MALNTSKPLLIATRQSALAIWQAEHVATKLKQIYPVLETILVGMTTKGDHILDTPLAKIGGKGLFVKELEQGILAGQAHIAVHSMKDVPMEFPNGLHIGAVLAREDPSDAFVSNIYENLEAVPDGGIIGTSSLRRECQLRAMRADLTILPLRGNVNTRLQRLDDGNYDAIILASAGLKRLGFSTRIRYQLPLEHSLPAIGQGAIGIECLSTDAYINNLIAPLQDLETSNCIRAERAMNKCLQGGCQVPIAGHAIQQDNSLYMCGLVGTPDGKNILKISGNAPVEDAEIFGTNLGHKLLAAGAKEILAALL